MRTPIAHALAWPERMDSGVDSLDLFAVAHLDFEPPDRDRFPCLGLAYEAIARGGTSPAVLNAANEVAVQSFLEGRLGFAAIAAVIAETLERLGPVPADSLEAVMGADREARAVAGEIIQTRF
jgi:1-deoxy-D-xylulose-5-phosphate reductoisomerase